MYEPTPGFYTTAVQAKTRRLNWHGTLTDTDGTDYAFTAKDIVKDSGTITEAVSGTEITLGTVYASQLEIGLYIDSVGVDRSKIYGGQISLVCTVSGGGDSGDIPLGIFNITEATQNGEVCTITAYDNMLKFDKEYLGVSGLATPYEWAMNFCSACGVTLGMSEADFSALPLSGVNLTLIWNDDIETYRDALSHLSGAVGAVATINRSGGLVLLPMGSKASVATVTTRDRFDSDIAHNIFQPNSVFVTNTETGEITTATAGGGTADLDLGSNAFLQAEGQVKNELWETTATRSVKMMLENLITPLSAFASVPIEAEIPCDPCLDLFDAVTVTGGQAPVGGITVRLTGIETHIGGSTKIKCAGASTAEARTAEQRATSNTAGESNLLMWQSSDTNSEQIVVDFSAVAWGDLNAYEWGDLGGSSWGGLNNGALERIVAETTLTVSKDWAKGVLNFTVNYDLSADAEIHYKVLIDDAVEWELVEQQTAGKIVKTITTPVSIWSATETQPHTFKVTMGGRTEES